MPNEIIKTIDIDAPVERVWRAITDHVEFGQWFGVRLEAPFAPGKQAKGAITHPGYEHVTMTVTVAEMTPPKLFSFRWLPYAIDPNVDYSDEEPTLVEFRLEPTPEGTLLTVTESGFDKIPAGRRLEAFRMNDGGWAEQMKNVAVYVAEQSSR